MDLVGKLVMDEQQLGTVLSKQLKINKKVGGWVGLWWVVLTCSSVYFIIKFFFLCMSVFNSTIIIVEFVYGRTIDR